MKASSHDQNLEFTRDAAIWPPDLDRRDFLRLMAASLALGGAGGCSRLPDERIVPYVRAPEQVVVGQPLWFATSMPVHGFSLGVLAESHEGRPTKIEGNPGHPASVGGTSAQAQASILTLCDPDRSQAVLQRGGISTWKACLADLQLRLAELRKKAGRGLRVLTETVTSPTLIRQLGELREAFPEMQWHQYEPLHDDYARRGAKLAFSRVVSPVYDFEKADIIVSLNADFLSQGPASVRYLREVMSRRGGMGDSSSMNRLYVMETGYTSTGAAADHRLPLRPGGIERWTWRLFDKLENDEREEVDGRRDGERRRAADQPTAWIDAVADDLRVHHGKSLVLAGPGQSPIVHALAHALNERLGNAGRTVHYIEPVEADPWDHAGSLRQLADDLAADQVELLLIVGANPVYMAPADVHFAAQLARAKLAVHLGLYVDETARLCHWHIPDAHYLESWSDGRAWDGTAGIVQPLIAPLYGGKTVHDLLSALSEKIPRSSYDCVQATWRARWSEEEFAAVWERSLHDGVIVGTQSEVVSVAAQTPPRSLSASVHAVSANEKAEANGGHTPVELIFQPDPSIGDGRFANNGWLQELPKPITLLTWDNAALLGPETARRFQLQDEDVVEIRHAARTVMAPVLVVDGLAEGVIVAPLGYGRKHVGRIADGVGFNANLLRQNESPWHLDGVTVHKSGVQMRREMHWIRIDTYFAETGGQSQVIQQPMLCQHCEQAPCEVVCPVGATTHSPEGLNEMTYNRCIGTRYCSNNCPYKVRRFNFLEYNGDGTSVLKLLHNPEVTVRSRGVMEKCTYCVQRINRARIGATRRQIATTGDRDVPDARIADGEVVTACQAACPAQAIVFGDINDPTSQVARLKALERSYGVLSQLGTRPRTTYLAKLSNRNPSLNEY